MPVPYGGYMKKIKSLANQLFDIPLDYKKFEK